MKLQTKRRLFQTGFFALFVLAPVLDIFRLDLHQGHFILFGLDWTLGLAEFQAGTMSAGEAAFNLFWRALLPIFGGVVLFIWFARHFGRLYCGWLCPHFSVVETINSLMMRAWGRPTLWERDTLPDRRADGRVIHPNPLYWVVVVAAVFGFAFLWALAFLTYLLPPAEIYANLFNGELTRNQFTFLTAASVVLTIEFMFARHLFCRFGCAVGYFQSLAWMSNRKALVVGFERERAAACGPCDSACDDICPMRLKPRSIKRRMFTCTQCAQCVSACRDTQRENPDGALLQWVQGTNVGDKGTPLIARPGELHRSLNQRAQREVEDDE